MSKPWLDLAWWELFFGFLSGVGAWFGLERRRDKRERSDPQRDETKRDRTD